MTDLDTSSAHIAALVAGMRERGMGLHADYIEALAAERDELVRVLSELHAVVEGECPSLFNEDSGGDAKLAIEIENLLKEEPQ